MMPLYSPLPHSCLLPIPTLGLTQIETKMEKESGEIVHRGNVLEVGTGQRKLKYRCGKWVNLVLPTFQPLCTYVPPPLLCTFQNKLLHWRILVTLSQMLFPLLVSLENVFLFYNTSLYQQHLHENLPYPIPEVIDLTYLLLTFITTIFIFCLK